MEETLQYNTQRPKMMIPEYGRNVQKMINFAKTIESKEERNNAVLAIIDVMGQLNPHLRDVEDYKHKLWTHLFIMSDFELNVDSPYPMPSPESLQEAPGRMKYSKTRIRYGHFGNSIQKMIDEVSEIKDEEEKKYMILVLANFMKKSFLQFNTDTVDDKVIADTLKELSGGKLILENPEEMTSTNTILKTFGITPNKRNKVVKKKNHKNHKKHR